MTEAFYFFDSYAIVEMIKGNANYSKYINTVFFITKLNLFEVYHSVLKDFGKEYANYFLETYYPFAVDYDKEIISEAARFKIENRKMNYSMADCVGYIISMRSGIKFLTGDKGFDGLDNVEFVK